MIHIYAKLLILILLLMPFALHAQNDSLPDQQLKEVVVTAEKPQVTGEGGVLSIDLPSVVKDKPVNNILEALGYLPGVVNNNGMIGLAGATSVTIIINGELTNMPVSNLYRLLYSLPVDKLKNVEIMYTAPAKYHVNGAVINVNLKEPGVLDGLQGQVRAGYNQAHYDSWGGGLFATYANKRWSFDLNYSLSCTDAWFHEFMESNHWLNGGLHEIDNDNRRVSSNNAHLMYGSASYKFSGKSAIKFTYNGQITTDVKSTSLSTGTMGRYENSYTYNSPITLHAFNLSYNSSFGFKAGGSYTYYEEDRNQSLYSGDSDAVVSSSSNYQRINRLRLYADQTHEISKWHLSYGVEYSYVDDYSRQTFSVSDADGFYGRLTEHTADAYIGIQHSFPWGLSFNASAKGEFYNVGKADNWNFIPQLGATYYTDPKNIFQLNFTSQRVYPSYWKQHGGTSYINEYMVIKGNPSLTPYMNYATQLSYIFKQKYVATAYFNYANDYSVQLPYQEPDKLQLIYQTMNMNYNSTVGLNLHIPVSVKALLNSTLSLNTYYNRTKADHFHDISFDRDKITFYASLNNTITFTKNSPFALTLEASYITPTIQGIADLSSMWRVNAGIKWTFARRNAELSLRADDIFSTWSPTMRIDYKSQDYKMKMFDRAKNLKLTFIWRFNGFKPKEQEKVDATRFGTGD